jgi:hypothetical protein
LLTQIPLSEKAEKLVMHLAVKLLTSCESLLLVLVMLDAKLLLFMYCMWKPKTFAMRKLKHFSQIELRLAAVY